MKETSIQVVYTDPGGIGYHCVYYMARLAAELLNGELVVLPPGRPTLVDKLGGILPRLKDPSSACLLICPSPGDLNSALQIQNWRASYGRLVAWVFDSFWPDHIPRWVRSTRMFDHVFVTELEDLATWRATVSAPVDWLPWGSDVLNLGSANPMRPLDLLRFGRQPTEWDDDPSNAQQCQSRMLSFQGRPPGFSDATDNERALMTLLGDTKFTLAFSNRVSPGLQTHPSREYITGRWTDSLAAGAIVAGIPPHSKSVSSLLWPHAILDVGTVNRAEGLELIASAVREWTPNRARLNYAKSLEYLDWRWRFKTLSEVLQIRSNLLDSELGRLRNVIHSSNSVWQHL